MEIQTIEKKVLVLDKDEIEKLKIVIHCALLYIKNTDKVQIENFINYFSKKLREL